jgi:high-affinity Fe2+/Pb2+ permease
MAAFSVPALFILFRESVEACVIVAVLLQLVKRTGRTRLALHGALTVAAAAAL